LYREVVDLCRSLKRSLNGRLRKNNCAPSLNSRMLAICTSSNGCLRCIFFIRKPLVVHFVRIIYIFLLPNPRPNHGLKVLGVWYDQIHDWCTISHHQGLWIAYRPIKGKCNKHFLHFSSLIQLLFIPCLLFCLYIDIHCVASSVLVHIIIACIFSSYLVRCIVENNAMN